MGTPDFAVPSLAALQQAASAQNWSVISVITQPDRPAGRGKKLMPSPVKQLAQAQGIPVMQPGRLRRDQAAIQAITDLAPDLIVVAAYGQILPPSVLGIPRFGCVNVHASLLPAYRGASPITAAILDGQEETGVSIMLMDEGMDTGPVLAQVAEAIHPEETTERLSQRLAQIGAEALVRTLPGWLAGEIPPLDQADLPGEVSLCRLVKKEDGLIDWQRPAQEIERMSRAYTPWPSAFTQWQGQNFKIWQAQAIPGQAEPGLVVAKDGSAAVGTGAGLLLLQQVQPAGKRSMPIHSFLNGAGDFIGSHLG
jgi:methionyl-tRNA formyltransferase